MRTHILFIIIAICSLSLTTSCTSREQKVVKRLEKLSKKLERQGNDYSITQWQRAAKEFKQIDEEIAKNYQDFTPKQLHEIGRLKGICVGAFSRYLEHIAKNRRMKLMDLYKGLKKYAENRTYIHLTMLKKARPKITLKVILSTSKRIRFVSDGYKMYYTNCYGAAAMVIRAWLDHPRQS